ncbi:FecR family protein [Sulfidibacter corallicola]|uniref:FecR domain-containing protein n=1 Tax=Sulfidibacter corallicola TaxID=2818388 RepID=A0A8A4TPA4_SULCO|nr:FecR family protein [Sulfidibacter corallicola]QTD50731.1 FecR domain-containing protein [Sulfidibacter corallicola]
MQGDKVTVLIEGRAIIYLSDGSELTLGNDYSDTEVDFELLKASDKGGITDVILKLAVGEVWVKAPEYADGSNFRIKTDSASAAVRGTVFGLRATYGAEEEAYTDIYLQAGALQIATDEGTPIAPNQANTQNGVQIELDENGNSLIRVDEGADPIILEIDDNNPSNPIPDVSGDLMDEDQQEHMHRQLSQGLRFNSGTKPILTSLARPDFNTLVVEGENLGATTLEIIPRLHGLLTLDANILEAYGINPAAHQNDIVSIAIDPNKLRYTITTNIFADTLLPLLQSDDFPYAITAYYRLCNYDVSAECSGKISISLP